MLWTANLSNSNYYYCYSRSLGVCRGRLGQSGLQDGRHATLVQSHVAVQDASSLSVPRASGVPSTVYRHFGQWHSPPPRDPSSRRVYRTYWYRLVEIASRDHVRCHVTPPTIDARVYQTTPGMCSGTDASGMEQRTQRLVELPVVAIFITITIPTKVDVTK
jgi:hypothetical protein